MNYQIVVSESTDPYINLSIEDFLLRNLNDNEKILFLYVNEKSVVMGRFQNPWIECLLDKMNDNNIKLVRRQSGGGTVYHDLGNLNFSFIESQLIIDKSSHCEIIINALKTFGVNSFTSNRSDLMCIDTQVEYKFSGSAFKQTRNRSLHHGTLLIDSKLDDLKLYLHAKKRLITTKATASIRKSVINLSSISSNITLNSMIDALVSSYNLFHSQTCKLSKINEKDFKYEKQYLDYLIFLKSKKWIYNETPKFTQNFIFDSKLGATDLELVIQKGIIKKAGFFHENFHTDINSRVMELFVGSLFTKKSIKNLETILIGEFSMFSNELTEVFSSVQSQVY